MSWGSTCTFFSAQDDGESLPMHIIWYRNVGRREEIFIIKGLRLLYSVQYTVRYSIGTSTYNCIPVQYFIISFFDQLLPVTDTYKIPLLALGSVADPDLDPNIFGRIQNRPRNCSKVSVLNIIFFFNLTIFNLIPLQTKSHCWPDVIKATVHLPDSSTFKRF